MTMKVANGGFSRTPLYRFLPLRPKYSVLGFSLYDNANAKALFFIGL